MTTATATVRRAGKAKGFAVGVKIRGLRALAAAGLAVIFAFGSVAIADTEYYRHVFFDNSLTQDNYYYSSGSETSPSTLVLLHDKLPVERDNVHTPPNAISLQWNSKPEGNWEAEIHVKKFRNRQHLFDGDTLSFWCFAPEAIAASDLPYVRIADTDDGFSKPVALGSLMPRGAGMPAQKWIRVDIPLASLTAASIRQE